MKPPRQLVEPRKTYARKWGDSSPFRVRVAEVPSIEGFASDGSTAWADG
jgi:hypothetical protein